MTGKTKIYTESLGREHLVTAYSGLGTDPPRITGSLENNKLVIRDLYIPESESDPDLALKLVKSLAKKTKSKSWTVAPSEHQVFNRYMKDVTVKRTCPNCGGKLKPSRMKSMGSGYSEWEPFSEGEPIKVCSKCKHMFGYPYKG